MTENPWRRPVIKGRRVMSAQERIWWSVRLDRATGCWNWQQARHSTGYGVFARWNRETKKKEIFRAHRFSYETFIGPAPDGLFVLHRCDNRGCCNPEHLFTGSHLDNMRDMRSKDRGSYGENHLSAKITEDQVREIRRRYAGGSVSQRELGEEYGLHQTAISHLILKENWKHVEA